MSDLFKFETSELDKLLAKYGLRKTWLNLLYTHLKSFDKFKYITENAIFSKSKLLPSNILNGLSIGEVSILYEYSVAKNNSNSRKSNGQFFTPDDVADFMASYSKKFGPGKWLDPCSGIGNLSWHLVAAQSDPEKFLRENLILSDKDDLALIVARCLLTISFQRKNKLLFDQIEKNFIEVDFLSVSDSGEQDLFSAGERLTKIPKHDFVIVNPPYLATKIDKRFETAKSGDLYAYFLENIIKSSRGFISITPQSFTNAKKFQSLRKLLLNNYENLKIFTFDNVPANIFKGIKFGSTNSNQSNSIRASIIVALPGKGKHQITPLLRWRSSERTQLFSNIEKLLADVSLTEDFFPKLGKDFEKLYASLLGKPTLNSIVSSKKTKFPLYVPSAPRYFIPALKKPAKRSSQKVLYFTSEENRNLAYMVINSSLLYWWWRVRDGGMTLSLETLMTAPLPVFKSNESMISALEKSEKNSKVFKQNAGALQENVKHPKELIHKLNKLIVPDYADKLLKLHGNSDVAIYLGK